MMSDQNVDLLLPPRPSVEYRHEYRFGVRFRVPYGPAPVHIDASVLKCVMFVGCQRKADYQIGGTAFFLIHPIDGTSHYTIYAVTAKHVVENAAKLSIDAGVYLRLNEKDGSASWLRTSDFEWERHVDPRVDVAVLPVDWDNEEWSRYDHEFIFWDTLLTDELISTLDILAGNELYFPGLFVRLPGAKANLPILRTGTIAGMPTEPMETELGLARVHLAEMRSIGGHSGSPVFVNTDLEKIVLHNARGDEEHNERASRFRAAFRSNLRRAMNPLLGLIHGHFPLRPDQLIANLPSTKATVRGADDFNSGIAAIVPAEDILAVLRQPRLVEMREKEYMRLLGLQGGTIAD